jgi:hypothetical protein
MNDTIINEAVEIRKARLSAKQTYEFLCELLQEKYPNLDCDFCTSDNEVYKVYICQQSNCENSVCSSCTINEGKCETCKKFTCNKCRDNFTHQYCKECYKY